MRGGYSSDMSEGQLAEAMAADMTVTDPKNFAGHGGGGGDSDPDGYDAEADDDDALFVRERLSGRADEHTVEAIGKTVAEANPDYPPGDDVLIASYYDKPNAKTYAFPESRVETDGG